MQYITMHKIVVKLYYSLSLTQAFSLKEIDNNVKMYIVKFFKFMMI